MHRLDLNSPEWQAFRARVLVRDGNRCQIGHLLGGDCHPILDVHHLTPVSEGGDPYDIDNAITACHSHHPVLEGIRRRLNKPIPPCRHVHRYDHAREECRQRRILQRIAA